MHKNENIFYAVTQLCRRDTVLLNLREKFLDPKTSVNQRELVSKAFVSMVEKTFGNERSLEILKGLMPEADNYLSLNFKASFERERGR